MGRVGKNVNKAKLSPAEAGAWAELDPPLGHPTTLAEIFPGRGSAESPSNISPNPSEVLSEVSEP